MSARVFLRLGFTLIEMLVVLVILAIVGAVTLPALRSNPGDQLTSSAGVLTNLMQRSRQTAVERGETVSLVVDAENARYWVMIVGLDHPDSLASYGTIDLASGATLAANESRARYLFEPSGAASGDSLLVRLAARTALITLDRWTGDAHAEIH